MSLEIKQFLKMGPMGEKRISNYFQSKDGKALGTMKNDKMEKRRCHQEHKES
jgi:hypothetical protein